MICHLQSGIKEQGNYGETIMSEQQTPLTYEGVLELFRESDRRFELRSQELDRKIQETNKQISALTTRIGEIVENMIGGDIVPQFRALGYNINRYARNLVFGSPGTEESGEIDLYLYNGDVAILIEAKTNLKTDGVREHIERLEKYRRCVDANGSENQRYIGAVAGAVVEDNVVAYAQKQGLYVIVQSGRAGEIIPSPEGFVPKKW